MEQAIRGSWWVECFIINTTKHIVPRSHQSTIFRVQTSAASKNFISSVPSSLLKNERSWYLTVISPRYDKVNTSHLGAFDINWRDERILEETICQQSTTYPADGIFSGEQRKAFVWLETMQHKSGDGLSLITVRWQCTSLKRRHRPKKNIDPTIHLIRGRGRTIRLGLLTIEILELAMWLWGVRVGILRSIECEYDSGRVAEGYTQTHINLYDSPETRRD